MDTVENAIIWGAGKWGILAYFYYRNKYNLIGYVDSDKKLWGQRLNGLEIYSPQILEKIQAKIIIANKNNSNEIKNQLVQSNRAANTLVFRIDMVNGREQLCEGSMCSNEVIVSFSGGIGNQMFQYVLYKIFQGQGKSVLADVSVCKRGGSDSFALDKAFPEIRLRHCLPEKRRISLALAEIDEKAVNREMREEEFTYRPELLDIQRGYIIGYHQSYKYADLVKEELYNDFDFHLSENREISHVLAALWRKGEPVSVHIRRGDYLAENLESKFGNVCTDRYYEKAIKLICSKVKNPVFCFFSDDIAWAKEKYGCMDSIFIEKGMFTEYRDWYDMYIMSRCKHNIIANSTFSWWGAWLNQSPEKIVVAPEKWLNYDREYDICPDNWIRL